MTKRELLFFCKRAFVCLLAGTVAGILLLLAAFALPTGPMLQHVKDSAEQMFGESGGKNAFLQAIEEERESFTDAIILQNAIEQAEGKSIYERAMMAYRHDLEEEAWNPEETLQAICSGADTGQMYLKEYSRYWHGYLIYVKPLLLVFTWKQLLWFGVILQTVLLAAVVGISVWKKKARAGIAVLTGYLLMKPQLMAASITMSCCWLITLFVLIYMLLRNDRLVEKGGYPVLFLLTGMLTSYFDFLTYPAATLGIPLCVSFLLQESESAKRELQRAAGYSVSWGIGYVGMWGMKWLVADLTLRQGTIKDALWTIIGRTEAIGGRPRMNGASYAIGLNFGEYQQPWHFWFMGAVVMVSAVLFVAACVRRGVKETMKRAIPFGAAFLLPFAWITVAQNHSALHARFTFRILAIAFMAVACVGIRSGQKLAEKRHEADLDRNK